MGDAWGVGGDVGHLAGNRLGAIERSAVGKLHHADQIGLVLLRDESTGHDLEHQEGDGRQTRIEA